MSKGLGKTERMCLEVLKEYKMCDSIEIAGRALGKYEVSNAEHTTFRRALNSLLRKAVVVNMSRSWHSNRCRWALPHEADAHLERVRKTFGQKEFIEWLGRIKRFDK